MNHRLKKEIPSSRLGDILDQSSLTQHLIRASGGDFRVEVRFQGMAQADFSERQCLGLHDRQYAWVREVALICKGEIWVLARSIIPVASLRGRARNLKFLGSRPLGATLFKDPDLKRKRFELARVNLAEFMFCANDNARAWARRSIFITKNQPILVAEAFLDRCPTLISDKT